MVHAINPCNYNSYWLGWGGRSWYFKYLGYGCDRYWNFMQHGNINGEGGSEALIKSHTLLTTLEIGGAQYREAWNEGQLGQFLVLDCMKSAWNEKVVKGFSTRRKVWLCCHGSTCSVPFYPPLSPNSLTCPLISCRFPGQSSFLKR